MRSTAPNWKVPVSCGGPIIFFGHRTPGKEQARNFIKTARLKRGNILPVLDIEWHRFMKDPKRSAREAKNFCREIKHYYGVNPIIYCSTNFYEKYLADTFPEDEYVLWIADYRECPTLRWQLWQHTDSHRIPGIPGKVDRNVFSGSAEEFKKADIVMNIETDFLVIGSGIAGLSYALKAAEVGKVVIVTKGEMNECNTDYAQGGIASVMYDPDTFEKHIRDTLVCGAGICDRAAVEQGW